jgi:hypothetical protein
MARTANGIKPVVALDIDGTLGPWHHHFASFLEDYTGKRMPINRTQPLRNIDWDGSVPFYRWLGVSKETYRQAKVAFRQGGFKRWMPTYYYAAELTRDIRKAGAEVWLCTTRPYLRLDNIDPDTRHWTRRNGIQYDGLLFGEKKYRDLVRIVGKDAVVCVVDDLPEMVRQADQCDLMPFLADRTYNGHDDIYLRIHRLDVAAEEICGMINEWKDGKRYGTD